MRPTGKVKYLLCCVFSCKGAGTEYDVECVIDKDTAITIVAEVKAKDGGVWLKAKSGYYVNKKYMKFIRYV